MVQWSDSHYRPGWDNGDVSVKETICMSMGWLVGESKDVIVLAANITDEDGPQRCGEMTIPRKSILKMNSL